MSTPDTAPSALPVAGLTSTEPPPVTRPGIGQLLALAGPVIVSRSAQVVIGFTDALMVGQLGQNALAATTTGATNAFNILVLPMGVCFVVQSFAAQLTGKGDAKGARRFAWYGLGVAVLAQLACMAALPFLDEAVGLLDYSSEVKGLMAGYLGYRLLSGGAAIGLEALGAYYGGLGNTRLPMLAQILSMVLNVFFNWLLIFGHLGFEPMGVAGAAIASSVATTIAFMVLLVLFLAGVGCTAKKTSGFHWAEMVRVLRFGLPSGFNWFIEFAAFSFFINVVLPSLGTSSVAALMSVIQLNSVAFMPAFALATAGSIFVGQAIGANAKDDVAPTVWLTLKTAGLWMTVIALLSFAFPRLLLRAFVSDDDVDSEAFLNVGVRMLMISCAWQLFDATAMVLGEALRAAGDTLFCFLARSAIAWFVFVPGAWVSVRVYGGGDVVAMVWLCAYLALLALVLALRFRSGRWRNIEMTGDALT